MASAAVAAIAQTPAKPAVTTPKPASTTAKSAASTTGIKLPPGIPPVHGILKTAFCLRYQDIKIGTGADAEPGKLYKVHYTGYRAADGVKFDSSYDHPGQPEKDKDGKPVLGEDGKPKVGPPQPMSFPQGMGRLIPGFDQGFAGMKIGGKRRIFIPWQLGYGTRDLQPRKAPAPGMPDFPGIPAKSDLIFDVELVDVTDMPAPAPMPTRPMPQVPPHPGASAPPNAVPTPHDTWAKPPASAPAQSASPSQPATTAPSATPAQSSAPAQPAASAPPSTPAPATAPTTPPSQSQPK